MSFLSAHFARVVGDAALVWTQNPLRLANDSEPQPDLMLLRPKADRCRSAHPRPEDVLLLIEVADTTFVFDRETKLPLYAKQGVLEVWIVDLDAEQLEIHREPRAGSYHRKLERRETDSSCCRSAADGGAPGRGTIRVVRARVVRSDTA